MKFSSYGNQQPKKTEEKVRTQIWGLTVEGNVRKLKMFMKIYRYRNHIANNSVEGEEKHIKVECNTKLVCLVSPAPQHRS